MDFETCKKGEKSLACSGPAQVLWHSKAIFYLLNITGGKQSFTAADEKLFTDYLAFAGIGLMNAQLFEMSILENKRSKILLNMAR